MNIKIIVIIMRLFVLIVNRTAKTKEYMRNWETVMQFVIKSRDLTNNFFHIKFKGGIAIYNSGKYDGPDIIIETDSDTFPKLMKGELDPQEAYILKKYSFKGSIIDASKFNYMSKLLQDSHPLLIRVAGFLKII